MTVSSTPNVPPPSPDDQYFLLANIRDGKWLDKQEFPAMTALEVVEAGECSGACLVAAPESHETCDCRCDGFYHGALAHAPITTPQPGVCP